MSHEDDKVHIKTFNSFEIKDESTGEVEAIIATLNVVDRDREVIAPGAIKSGSKVVMSSYGHDTVGGMFGRGALPVGKGAVVVEGDKAIFRGKVFLSTERGRETLAVLKEMGKQQEWSFGFRVMKSIPPDEEWSKKGAEVVLTKLHVFEVSPVAIGAGVGTSTLAAKEADEDAARVKAEEDADVAAAEQARADAATKAAADAQAAIQREVDEEVEAWARRGRQLFSQ